LTFSIALIEVVVFVETHRQRRLTRPRRRLQHGLYERRVSSTSIA
jgi:hypothetical protein